MAKALFNLGRWSYLHKWTVIVAWVLIVAGIGGSAATLQKGFMDQFSIPGMPSAIASKMIEKKFPDEPNPIRQQMVYVVFEAPEGQKLEEPQNMEAMDAVVSSIKEDVGQKDDVLQLVNPVTLNKGLQEKVIEAGTSSGLPEDVAKQDAYALRTLSDDGRYGISTFTFDVLVPADIEPENHAALEAAMQKGRDAGLKVEAMGPGMQAPVAVQATSEVIGLSVAFIVLIITFGSIAAAGLPLLTAVVGIIIGSLAVVLSTRFTDVNSITPVLAVMIGLAVGIDYALFILSRYRAERARGMTRADAVGMATGTAGSSVVFAGLTVIVALAALVIAKIPFLSLMGISAAFTVFVAVLVSLTLLPALMALFGDKIFALKVPGIAGNPFKGGRRPLFAGKTMGRRWVELIHKVPGLFLVGSVGLLLALAVPAMNLSLALPSDSTAEFDSTNRKAITMAEEGFGPGRNSQLIIVADADNVNPEAPALQPLIDTIMAADPQMPKEDAARKASYSYALDQLKANVGVEHVQLVGMNKDGTGVKMVMTPSSGPLDPATKQLMNAVRAQQNQLKSSTGLETGVTGLVPIEIDITDRLGQAMPIYLSVVVGLAIVLLLLVFRSFMVPLTAGLGFLLSVAAAFGVTVLVFQEGLWGMVATPGPLVSFIPIFMIGVTFGLAMDYQVFLVSRMREHFTHNKGKPTPGSRYTAVEESVVEGFSLGARVVTAAAIIMISVFIAFIGQPLAFVKVFGFALGAAVLFDAFVVRMTLIPASMFLLGRSVWWLPKWFDRILPTVDVEGAALEGRIDELVKAGRAEQEREAAGAGAGGAAIGTARKMKKPKKQKLSKREKKAQEQIGVDELIASKTGAPLPEPEVNATGVAGAGGIAALLAKKKADAEKAVEPEEPEAEEPVKLDAAAYASGKLPKGMKKRSSLVSGVAGASGTISKPQDPPRKRISVAELARREGTELKGPRRRRAVWDPSDDAE
ncbi:MMPL family transporter [Corynebacterium sp. H113]|uniref:MMPL family transporter n=1 Tax=Corynebacterium sp. H113 TaxID=3133419 RepID=UPI0030B68B38